MRGTQFKAILFRSSSLLRGHPLFRGVNAGMVANSTGASVCTGLIADTGTVASINESAYEVFAPLCTVGVGYSALVGNKVIGRVLAFTRDSFFVAAETAQQLRSEPEVGSTVTFQGPDQLGNQKVKGKGSRIVKSSASFGPTLRTGNLLIDSLSPLRDGMCALIASESTNGIIPGAREVRRVPGEPPLGLIDRVSALVQSRGDSRKSDVYVVSVDDVDAAIQELRRTCNYPSTAVSILGGLSDLCYVDESTKLSVSIVLTCRERGKLFDSLVPFCDLAIDTNDLLSFSDLLSSTAGLEGLRRLKKRLIAIRERKELAEIRTKIMSKASPDEGGASCASDQTFLQVVAAGARISGSVDEFKLFLERISGLEFIEKSDSPSIDDFARQALHGDFESHALVVGESSDVLDD